MRLAVLDQGHRLRVRLFMSVVKRTSGVELADVPKTLLYRPDFFGRAMLEFSAAQMRGPSFWTAAEREYLAMQTARWQQSPYCLETHAEMTRIAGTGEIDPDEPESPRGEVLAVLRFLEPVTQAPDDVLPQEADAVRRAGVPESAVVEALQVNFMWNIITRLGNAFGFQLQEGQLHAGTRSLHKFGYRFPAFLTGKGGTADLRAGVLDGPAHTAPELRSAAAAGGELAETWRAYATKVRDRSYRITDDDIGLLAAAGHSEDEIFEITVAAAVGAANRSLDAGLRALGRQETTA